GIYQGTANSDHYSFWQYGYDAIMDHENIFNPYYHSTQDLFQYLDPSYLYLIAKAGIACLSALARPFNPGIPEIPQVLTPFNFEKTFTKNPLFKLYTTDPQNDPVIYRILWSLDTLFTSPESVTTPIYPSGQIITYTFPIPLLNKNVYWFKVKAKDTTSSGGWSPFTQRFSLTIDTTMLENTCSWYQTKGAQFKYNIFNGTKIEGDSVVLIPVGTYIDTLLFQNFEGGTIPPGWTVIDGNNDGIKWTVGTTSDLGTYTPPNYGTRYAYYSDDDAGNGVINYNEELWTPAIGIPSTSANLKFKYGYGFRVYQTGEKYRVHFRKKVGGSWTNWTQLRVYTTSAAGIDSFDLSNQLPCDSIQFRFFYSDSTSSSHWGWACAADNVFLIYSYTYQNNEGTMTTAPCFYNNLSITYPRTNWGYIHWEKSTPLDSVGIQVEYFNGSSWQLVPDNVLPGNSQGFFTNNKIGQVSIINLDTTTYNTLRLKTIFVRKQNAQNPALLWCEIGNQAVSSEEFSKNILKPQISAYPTIFNDKLNIKYLIPPFERAKIKIYNASGRIVKEITYNSSNTPISGTYVFEGKEISQGIYFIRFETKDFRKNIKVIHIE
ncbi:MAG: T9SS type A sorting domain-containing protein, partial [candidate division WOR-3 bacterium]